MTRFRPCIDLHSGQVKQIVGGTLGTVSSDLKTNYISQQPANHFAQLYKNNVLTGAHVIMLGPGNEQAAEEALSASPGYTSGWRYQQTKRKTLDRQRRGEGGLSTSTKNYQCKSEVLVGHCDIISLSRRDILV